MKYLYKITFILIAALSSVGLLAQDIQFSYIATPNGNNTTTVTFSATNTGGNIENMTGFTIDFYYDQNETTVTTVDFTGISAGSNNWGTANQTITNHQAVNNPLVPITHTGYFVYQNFDNNFLGIDMNPGETLELGTVIYDNSPNKPNDGGEGFIETTVEQPGLEYFGDDFVGHPVETNGTQQQILPIELRSFTATKNEKTVELDWITSLEANASHFEVERSLDGNNWKYLGKVKAVGESTIEQQYSFLDNTLPLNARENHKTFYYRLNMVDKDGQQEYSDIRSVRFDLDGEADFLVYPNPTVNEVFVNLSSITPESGPATLNVINMNGQLIKKVTLQTSDDIRVDVSDLTGGVYNFIVSQKEDRFSQKVIIID